MSEQNLTPEQRNLLGAVIQTEQNLGTGPTIEVDDQGNPKEAAPSSGDAAAENKAMLQTLIGILTPALPFLPEVYNDPTIERIANAYTAVEEKYGWNLRGMMGVEVQLAVVTIPPTMLAIVLARLHFEEKKRQAQEKDITPPPGADPDGSHQ